MPHGVPLHVPSTSIREPAMRTNAASFDAAHAEPSLRTAEVARALGVSPRAIRTWADEGKIACYRTFGGHRLFTASEVRRVLASWSGGALRPHPPATTFPPPLPPPTHHPPNT